jgi:hypothetical protein
VPEQDPEALIEALVEQYRASLRRALERPPRTITEIEDLVEEVSHQVDRDLEQALLDRQAQADPPANQARCPHCAGTARYRCRSARTLLTRHGERQLLRRYFYCAVCRRGFAPLDGVLGLDQEATTPTVRAFSA